MAISGFLAGLIVVAFLFAPGGLIDTHQEITNTHTEVVKNAPRCNSQAKLQPDSISSRVCSVRFQIALLNCQRYPRCLQAMATLLALLQETPGTGAGGVVPGGGSIPSGEPGGSSPPTGTAGPAPESSPGHGKPPQGGSGGGGPGGGGEGGSGAPGGGEEQGSVNTGSSGEGTAQQPAGEATTPEESGPPPPAKSTAESVVEGLGETVQETLEVVCTALQRLTGVCPE